MTKAQIREDEVLKGYANARKGLVEVQDALADAADACKGTDLESFLNQTWDALGDLRFELGENERCYEKILREAAG